jgi:hypothetical protein
MNVRYAEIATELAKNLGELKFDPEFITPFDLAFQWTATNDARGYAILGDPAVRLPLAPPSESQDTRPALTFASRPGVLPVVLSGEALEGLSESERQAAEQASASLAGAAGQGEVARERTAQEEGGTVSRSDTATHMTTPGGELPVDPQKTAPRQQVQADRPIPAAPPAGAPAPTGQPFATPIDGLAFALDIYTTDRAVSFSAGGVSFNVLDDAKEKVRLVVVNLNEALQNLSERMKQVTAEAATLKITTSVVDDLKNLDPNRADQRFITRISLGGDVELFVPRQSEEVDELLLSLHKEMVNQALTNRLEMVKAIAETVASLFGGQRGT